jgi:hypothetical protein
MNLRTQQTIRFCLRFISLLGLGRACNSSSKGNNAELRVGALFLYNLGKLEDVISINGEGGSGDERQAQPSLCTAILCTTRAAIAASYEKGYPYVSKKRRI